MSCNFAFTSRLQHLLKLMILQFHIFLWRRSYNFYLFIHRQMC